jgi:ABC-2 type transport system permease protein
MKNNLKRYYRHKVLFAVTFLLPVMICSLFGLIDFDQVSLRVGVLSGEERSGTTKPGEEDYRTILYQVLEQSKGISFTRAKEDSLNMDLMTGHYQVVLDCRGESLSELQVIAYKPEKYTAFLKEAVTAAVIDREALKLEGLKQKGLGKTERSITILLTLFMVFTILYASLLLQDKQSGTYLRYQYAKSTKAGYIAGHIASVFIMTLLQVIFCMALLSILSNGFHLNQVEFGILAVVLAGLATLVAVVICLISKSEVQAGIIASSAAVLMSLLGGTFVAVDAMPRLLRMISYASPMRWVVELLRLI